MVSMKRVFCGSVLAIGLTIAVGHDAKASLLGYPCSAELVKQGTSTSAYTEIAVDIYSAGGCTGSYQGTAFFYSAYDCTSASGCPAYNNQLGRFSDVSFSTIFPQLTLAAANWRRVFIPISGAIAIGLDLTN